MRAFPRCKEEETKEKKGNVKYLLLEQASAILPLNNYVVTQSNS